MASDRQNLFWTIAHIVLGAACTVTPFALIIWFYFILFTNFFKANSLLQKKKPAFFLMFFSYLISFEVLDRMAKTSPFIPYELGKYFLVLVGILGLLHLEIKSPKGYWMVLLITPAVFYDFSGQRDLNDIINNYIGPLTVGLGLVFAYRLNINKIQFNQTLKLIWLGCLASLVFTYIKTPDFENISFTLSANNETTAGHSSNQVSTILGLGMFLSFYSMLNRLNFSGIRIFDILILFGFTFQGLLSFSRGGMLVGIVGILILLIFPESSNNRKTSSISIKIGIIALIALYGVFEIANKITDGNLLLRYQGETAGTVAGTKKVTFDHFVTGRIGIFEKDLDLWNKNILFGVGAGVSQYLRDADSNNSKVASHIELSRLLAEHGILGFIYAYFFLVDIPLKLWRLNSNSSQRIILISLIAIAILTTFHAAMRTFVTPLLMILGSLKIKELKLKSPPTYTGSI